MTNDQIREMVLKCKFPQNYTDLRKFQLRLIKTVMTMITMIIYFLKIIKLFQKTKIMEIGKNDFERAIICNVNDVVFPDFLTKLQE